MYPFDIHATRAYHADPISSAFSHKGLGTLSPHSDSR
jgi:hypothetical protein